MRRLISCEAKLRPEIPQTLKNTVIQLYLQGLTRNEIASRTGISQGGVSNIIAGWKTALGYPLADELREFSMTLKRLGINAQQSAMGVILVKMIQDLGVDEDNFRTFISELYQRCLEVGLHPQKIADYAKQLVELSESIPLSDIPQYIADKTTEKRELEKDIRRLHEQQSQARSSLEIALKEKNESITQLNKYCELKTRLEKTGMSMDDPELFAQALEGARKFKVNPERVAMLATNFDASSAMQAQLEKSVNSQEIKLKQVTNDCARAERVLESHYLTISKYKKLEEMSFGLPMLTKLHDIIHEVTNANNISHDVAVQKFLNDMAENFSPVLGFEGKLTAIKSEIEKKTSDLIAISTVLDSKKDMAKVLALLFLTRDTDKINDLPSSLQCTPSYMQNQVASSAVHEGTNRLAEGPNQNIELAREHVGSEVAGIGNSVDVQSRMALHMVIARMFPWNFGSVVGDHPPSIHAEDFEDIRERQELAFARNIARNTSNTTVGGG